MHFIVCACSLSISMDRNAPYIAVGVKRHNDSEYEILIYNHEKRADQVLCQVIRLGKKFSKPLYYVT